MKIATLVVLALMIVTPTANLFPRAPQRDVPAEVESAKRALQGARNDLEHAGGDWGGHHIAAMNDVSQARKGVGGNKKVCPRAPRNEVVSILSLEAPSCPASLAAQAAVQSILNQLAK